MQITYRLSVVLLLATSLAIAQTPTATITGRVVDQTKASIAGARVDAINVATNIARTATTNEEGLFSVVNLQPGVYRVEVSKEGFKSIVKPDVTLHVQDVAALNFSMSVGPRSESVTVEGGAPLVNTESAAVSTVVDRQFAENLPLNGRSFQTLIELTPGVVLTASNVADTGQFSINGQRANANYWTVDGVSANIGIKAAGSPGSGLAGTLGGTSVFGGTNSLVSVDALQEFRIQTSTYAPEFGRTPGGQISILTRSGTNRFHGTAFEYLRNDALDANDWFNGFKNNPPLPKPKQRQNDFGGTLSGPVVKDKTFFFFSYEGFRLRLPETALTLVPDLAARQSAAPALQTFLNAFPLPNGPADPVDTGVAEFNASYSNPATLDAYSLRVDHKLNDKLNLFGRYNYSPSKLDQRGGGGFLPLSSVLQTRITTHTGTLGAVWVLSPAVANDFRFNYSSTDGSSSTRLDNFGGAAPLSALPLPSPFTARNAVFTFSVFALGNNGNLLEGTNGHNQQRQLNIVDSVAVQKSSHSLKFGLDYRRLSPHSDLFEYAQLNFFSDIPSAGTGTSLFNILESSVPTTFLFRNLGFFAQDTWRIVPRLTMTYGLRWDVDLAPSSLRGPKFNAVTGFNLGDLSNLALLPQGTSPYKTKWGNLAPRIGLAYQVSQSERWQTVLRGGFGVFYDLASSEAGNFIGSLTYPFGAIGFTSAPFPLSPIDAQPPIIEPPTITNGGVLSAFDPNLELPYTLQWNVAVEQSLGRQQTVSVTYLGAAGRRLIQTAGVSSPNPNLNFARLITDAGTSDYNALQVQFRRRLSRGLQVLASYSWSHSLDTASAGSTGSLSNALSTLNSRTNRGASDFDVRNAGSIALTYEVPVLHGNFFTNAILRDWSVQNVIHARSATPVDVFFTGFVGGFQTNVRPDVIAGQPVYLNGSQYPGGRALNSSAFTPPPPDPVTGFPSRQGNLPRNALRGFPATQWDFAVHRGFPLYEAVQLQFRAEMFNILNHPNFGPPVGNLGNPIAPNPQFGQSVQMLGRSLGSGAIGAGARDPLYQPGGPRSVQFALKVVF